ncbi:sugar isomerase domain-containing protein [Coriobacteriales bacterium OH1046]|nr:sugar isomerase domain-containing protein [Coriobacteriales bacterium OH1046]
MGFAYIDRIRELIDRVEDEEAPNMQDCVCVLADAILGKHSIYIFGASHAGILAQESFYRAGGLMPITPIWAREVLVDREPITLTSEMERCVGYGTTIAKAYPMKRGDVLIVHSVSGRNPVAIEIAIAAREVGMTVIGITNLAYSRTVSSRHPLGKNMYEFCDIVLDNHGDIGDACVDIAGTGQKAAPTSTVIGVLMLNAIYAETANELVRRGVLAPPVFCSANVDGGDEMNRRLLGEYADWINYRY